MTDFEYETELQVRFRDLDAMGHVNNAVYATYLEQARVDYYADVLGVGLDDIDTVLVNLEIDYRHEVTLDDGTVTTIHHAPTEPGESGDDLTRYRGRGTYVLEVPRGYANATGLAVGDRVVIPADVASD